MSTGPRGVSPTAGREALPPFSVAHLAGTVVSRVAEVVARTPAAAAAVGPGATLTYAALDALAGRIATALTARVGRGDEPIGLLVAHDVLAPAAMLGVLRAGRGFAFLDAAVPAARNADLLARSGAPLLLTDRAHHDAAVAVAGGTVPVVDADTDLPIEPAALEPAALEPAALEPAALEPAALEPTATVTPGTATSLTWSSGSTGRPKGVVFDHRATLLDAWVNIGLNEAGPADRVGVVLPLAFGAGSAPLVWSLLTGSCAVLHDARGHSAGDLLDIFADARVDVLHATPSLLRALSAAAGPGHPGLAGLRLVTSGGEAAFGADLAALRPQLAPDCRWLNRVGSSEAATISFWEHRAGEPIPPGPLPAGRPASGVRIAVERPDGSPADPGEVGDLVVSSPWVAAGYWREPELSAARFGTEEPRPYERAPWSPVRTVRGGDLGMLLPDGSLQFRGRRDNAVKIRGYLVEPAEVEAHLRADPTIAEAAVAGLPAGQPGSTRLVAWVAPRPGASVSPATLRRRLAGTLPAWMVPTAVVVLPALPHNERGKLDRAALPPPAVGGGGREPRSDYERLIADAAAGVLGLPALDADEDFFAAGGDSLAAEELLARIGDELGVTLPSSVFSGGATVAGLAAAAAAGRPAAADLTTLAAGGAHTPLFCFAGAGGLALAFLPLARRLGGDRPVHAIQAHALEARGLPDWTVGRAAARAARAILAVSPTGPWILAGHSWGAFVALETAHLLRAAGDVEFVVLLDPRVSPQPGEAPEDLGQLDPAPGSRLAGPAADRGATAPAAPRSRRPAPAGHLAFVGERALAAARLGLTGLVPRPGVEQFDLFHRHGRRMMRWHRVRPWAGRGVVFRASDTAPDCLAPSAELISGPVEVRTVAGRHLSMLREPWVADLADQLGEVLAKVPPAGP